MSETRKFDDWCEITFQPNPWLDLPPAVYERRFDRLKNLAQFIVQAVDSKKVCITAKESTDIGGLRIEAIHTIDKNNGEAVYDRVSLISAGVVMTAENFVMSCMTPDSPEHSTHCKELRKGLLTAEV